ncbi:MULTISPECIES: hypothetical protein [Pseudoxanthomonas]|uniref:CdiI immunity protein domain-containing protein n=1 Tax=Pseudoxanthomonas winnipegensis TaxID=2480810 RepID=A0AAW8G9P3_9GAMM|nr:MULTISPECIES: hypothetical protein [Pseudoxanthomonas]MDQ1119121.1 hypothetical protein [Pseudoxanthomonas winnipegensis]MDR6137677.1 hypothetical protein [Pseudoxanthomonas sp. SORGH_AS_0997]
MISRELHSAIDRWARFSTWHTCHSSDNERLFELVAAFESAGPQNFNPGEFMDVADELIRQHHPELQADFLYENLSAIVIGVEKILGYVAYRNSSTA